MKIRTYREFFRALKKMVADYGHDFSFRIDSAHWIHCRPEHVDSLCRSHQIICDLYRQTELVRDASNRRIGMFNPLLVVYYVYWSGKEVRHSWDLKGIQKQMGLPDEKFSALVAAIDERPGHSEGLRRRLLKACRLIEVPYTKRRKYVRRRDGAIIPLENQTVSTTIYLEA